MSDPSDDLLKRLIREIRGDPRYQALLEGAGITW